MKKKHYHKRKLNIGEEIWHYCIFHSGLSIFNPIGAKRWVPMTDFTGWSPNDLERLEWKSDWMEINPSDVKDFITKGKKKIP